MIKRIFKKAIVAILNAESRLILKRYKPKIVAVTGSVGKTSTKDAIATVLATHFKVRKSEKSFNSEIGVPLTIMGCKNAWSNPIIWMHNIFEGLSYILFPHDYPEWLVLEVGSDRPGDIKRLASWLKPDISVVTYVGSLPVHVEFFESPEMLAEEKSALVAATGEKGIVILNNDDEVVANMARKARGKVYTYGFKEGASARASNSHIAYEGDMPAGITFKLDEQGKSIPIRINGVVGDHYIYSTLAAFLVGSTLGINLVAMAEAMEAHVTPPGRSKLIEGLKGTVLIDDTYNSSPAALRNALETLGSIKVPGRKIAVLGDMMELGKYTIEAHTGAGKLVAKNADIFFAVGQRAKFIAEGAIAAGMDEKSIYYFDDSISAGVPLQEVMQTGDCILIKGSQYMRMERITEEVMAKPLLRDQLLVRQEKEWINKK